MPKQVSNICVSLRLNFKIADVIFEIEPIKNSMDIPDVDIAPVIANEFTPHIH